MKFEGSSNYVATPDLMLAVNASMTLRRPLLVKGEPGTGKTMLAEEAAASLGLPLLEWHIKSTTKAQQGLYEYDAVSRLRDSQLGDPRVKDIHNYILKGVLWQAFTSETPVALLIDEIDKADIEFPNDLLLELDRMEFYVYETGETIKARRRHLSRQLGLTGAGLALDQQGPFQRDRGVDGHHQILVGDIGRRAFETHSCSSFVHGDRKDAVRPVQGRAACDEWA